MLPNRAFFTVRRKRGSLPYKTIFIYYSIPLLSASMTINLGHLLEGHIFAFVLAFMRLGTAFMMFPGIGEAFVPTRTRFLFAGAFTFLVAPLIAPSVPPVPAQVSDLVWLMVREALIGIFFTTILRMILGIVEVAGTIVAMETGLSNAMILNPALANQSALTGAMLSIAAIVILFATGFDHFLLKTLMSTYDLFPINETYMIGSVTEAIVSVMSKSFMIGVQLSSPFIIVGLLMYLAMGVMQKMMPQIQLFLVILPVQIWGGFFLFAACVGLMLTIWLEQYDELIGAVFLQ
jgi:flagellar biosynthetic protein FliR